MRCGVRTLFLVLVQISTILTQDEATETAITEDFQEITMIGTTLEPITNWDSRAIPLTDIFFDSIIIIDNKTILITDFHYPLIKNVEAYFYVGNETGGIKNSVLVPSRNGSKVPIGVHSGENVTLSLPGNLTSDSVDYVSIWCPECNESFGYFEIPKIEPPVAGNMTVVTVQKCCPLNQVLTGDGCAERNVPFNPTLNVHRHNSTHINDEPIAAQSIVFQPFIHHIVCEHNKYPLIPEEDQFAMLQNGSLLYLSEQRLLNFDSFCMESVDLGDQKPDWITTAIICMKTTDVPVSNTIFYIYSAGTLLSAVLLIATSLVFLLIKDIRDTRGKCVIGFSSAMAAAFIFLGSAQIFGIENLLCHIFGIIIQFFLVLSFTWLSLLSWETHYKIKNYNNEYYVNDKKRFRIYLAIGLAVPILISLISYFVDKMPGIPNTFLKPKFGKNACWFDQNNKTMVYFYLPIAIAIVFNVILGIMMKCKLVLLERHRKNDISWKAIKPELKPMFRSCMFILCVMTACWIMEMISFAVKDLGGLSIALDIIDSLQGLFIFMIFVLHRPVRNKLAKIQARKYFQKQKRKEEEEKAINVFETNADSNHFDPTYFLTDLRHMDSVENLY